MNTRFYNAKVYTGNEPVFDGEVRVEGATVSYAGKAKPSNLVFEREINVNGNLVMPGLKNAHTHSAMTFLRSYADDLPLDKWLHEQVFPMEAKLTPEHIYHFSKLAFLEYISGGTTTAFDMYFEPEATAQAAAELGFRLVFCGAVNDFGTTVDKLAEYYDKFNNYKNPGVPNGLISYRLGFHAEYTNGTDNLKELAKLSQYKKAPLFSHNSETLNEVRGCIERHGTTPTVLFDRLGMYEYGGGGFHCVYMSDEDIEIMKRKNLWAVTNPASNLKLASGIAPVEKLRKADVNLAIGTDGAASNNSLDMFREIYLAGVLQKYVENDASAMPAEIALKMATSGSANAMGLPQCASLSEGSQADIIVIDLNKPNMQPLNHILKNIVYSGQTSNVKLTMIAGRIVYENGEFPFCENPEKIYEKANELCNELKRK